MAGLMPGMPIGNIGVFRGADYSALDAELARRLQGQQQAQQAAQFQAQLAADQKRMQNANHQSWLEQQFTLKRDANQTAAQQYMQQQQQAARQQEQQAGLEAEAQQRALAAQQQQEQFNAQLAQHQADRGVAADQFQQELGLKGQQYQTSLELQNVNAQRIADAEAARQAFQQQELAARKDENATSRAQQKSEFDTRMAIEEKRYALQDQRQQAAEGNTQQLQQQRDLQMKIAHQTLAEKMWEASPEYVDAANTVDQLGAVLGEASQKLKTAEKAGATDEISAAMEELSKARTAYTQALASARKTKSDFFKNLLGG